MNWFFKYAFPVLFIGTFVVAIGLMVAQGIVMVKVASDPDKYAKQAGSIVHSFMEGVNPPDKE